MKCQGKGRDNWIWMGGVPGGLLKKVLYGEAPPRGTTPYPFMYQFLFRIGTPFVYLLLEKTPLSSCHFT